MKVRQAKKILDRPTRGHCRNGNWVRALALANQLDTRSGTNGKIVRKHAACLVGYGRLALPYLTTDSNVHNNST